MTAALLGGLACSPAVAENNAFCRDAQLDQEVQALTREELPADRLAALAARLDDAGQPDQGCGPQTAYCVGLRVALAAVDAAYVQLRRPAPDLAAVRATLEQGHRHGSPWQLLVALGDVEAAQAHGAAGAEAFRDSAVNLQGALNAISEPPLCVAFGEIRPEPDDIRRIRKRAEESVLLSPSFDVTRTRSGECGGILLSKVRGIVVESTPLPITFASGKADLTPAGRKAADALLQCLKEKGLPAVTLTGHTDDHGPDGYNMQLSATRLATVDSYLKAGGYGGSVRLIPKGKREPFQPDDPSQHSTDELDQMNRRVELRDAAP
ncbi:OmpA family protein [Lichenifustis flavocetrariae]|uniref:OmpA family protein n=1 Tax=Lichenifustis flavocetrariae TaxID=2949735 RepID=A0AA42CNF4_9HYPH|nr:OmpA family protein [Lichenifustis flavocetrariae]MCW6509362.1 OmpA family protein [Lichenifustis flavocetrariae]